jgi:hypothetical protein
MRLKCIVGIISAAVMLAACGKEKSNTLLIRDMDNLNGNGTGSTNRAVFLILDEDCIDNGNPPNNFSDRDVNDHVSRIGLRTGLPFFQRNIGKTINLHTGEVGDEGWFAIRSIPASWDKAGPTNNGARNYLLAGYGLGSGNNPELFLDKVPGITPLRAQGIAMLTGQKILAVVYDSDISINYNPLNGNLKGENLGLVAFEVLGVRRRTDGSGASLPVVSLRILDVESIRGFPLYLFSNAPAPRSSSEPDDIDLPPNIPGISLTEGY